MKEPRSCLIFVTRDSRESGSEEGHRLLPAVIVKVRIQLTPREAYHESVLGAIPPCGLFLTEEVKRSLSNGVIRHS